MIDDVFVFVQLLQRIVAAAMPWLVGLAAGFFVLWIILLCREAKPFEERIKWFGGLAFLKKSAVVAAICLFTLWGGSKERSVPSSGPIDDIPSSMARVAETVQLRTLPESVPPDAFAVTDFAVDPQEKIAAFEVAWESNLFDSVDSRHVDLFMSTNLSVCGWFPVGCYLMPAYADSHAFTVASNDVMAAYRQIYVDSFSRTAFFRFGLDFDSDGDGLTDSYENLVSLTDPSSPDTDGDGMPDGWEALNGLDPLADDSGGDSDGDGLANLREYGLGTSPVSADTDGDGLSDGAETG